MKAPGQTPVPADPQLGLPEWCDPAPWLEGRPALTPERLDTLLAMREPGLRGFVDLATPGVEPAFLERMARKAERLTRQQFGRTVSLYAPLYLSNHCRGGCAYCGFASDRRQERRRLTLEELDRELEALQRMGFEDLLLLTGERCEEAGFDYLLECVTVAARRFHQVSVESFAMTTDEYRALYRAGCSGVTLYQETYDPRQYENLHRWGPKRDFLFRLEAPARALEAGMRTVGLGCLLGLSDPLYDTVALFRHAEQLRKQWWRSGVMLSFPRIRPEAGKFDAPYPVSDAYLAQIVFAFRLCLPDVPLVLSTREAAPFRDGMAGVGVNRMSAASQTTVGGYAGHAQGEARQFAVSDTRNVVEFSQALRRRGLEPVFKNWDAVFQARMK